MVADQVVQSSVAYLQGWVSRFKNDKSMIIYTSTEAVKAASYILDLELPAVAMAA